MNQETALLITIWSAIFLSLLWAFICTLSIKKIKVVSNDGYYNIDPYSEKRNLHDQDKLEIVQQIGLKIAKGANTFLIAEYKVMTIFIILFSIIVFFLVDFMGTSHIVFYSTIAFVVGSFTSILCGYIGMSIAVTANYRTTYKATFSLPEAFQVSYQAGCVMGFSSIGLGLGILLTLMLIYKILFQPKIISIQDEFRTYATLMELLASYGLGGSAMALFGRVGGGIYTKAADVGADLVGKVEEGLDEDSPRNPATIADNVGDNVGDIAGMGSDLFGSFAESTCATLVLISNSVDLIQNPNTLYYPLLILSVGIFACFITSLFGIYIYKVNSLPRIQKALNLQLLISTLLTLIGMYFTIYILPYEWNQIGIKNTIKRIHAFICPAMGLISGFIIGVSTDYFTSHAYKPVREMAKSCSSGAAINIIYGLALGYLSTIIPVILISITIITCIKIMGLLGVALAAIGMLSTLPIGLAIDAYGPICDNAGGIAEMSQLGEDIREITDALDAAGNTTAAVGKGFAIGSAALVSLALYGAFLTRARQGTENNIKNIEVINPWIIGMFFIGAMLPYAFSALTMKSVGIAAVDMVQEVRRQFQDPNIRNGQVEPDYARCIQVSTNASLREMILPGLLVIITPIFFGIFFHPILVAGLLPGALLSGVQLAISMSNTGGAWDNTKKYIESGEFIDNNGQPKGKGSFEHKAAVTGDTVGDPLKDTSGPSLNILIKLMAIISLVFIRSFQKTSLLSGLLGIEED